MTRDQIGNIIKWVGSFLRNDVYVLPCAKTVILKSATAATPVTLISGVKGANDEVPLGGGQLGGAMKFVLGGIRISVQGSTAWATTMTKLIIADGAGTEIAEVLIASLTGNNILQTFSEGILYKNNSSCGAKFVAPITVYGDHNAGAGSDISVQIAGTFVAAVDSHA